MKKYFLMLAVALVAFTACETPEGPEGGKVKGTLDVTEKSVDVAFYGGEGVVNYTITDGEAGAKPTVTANQEWVNNITVADTITFNVDFNNVEEQRVATLHVTYGEQTFDVFVRQDAGMAVDVEFVASALNGEYFGTQYSEDPNYFIILSKNGTTGWSDLYLDTYYRFDIYSKTYPDASATKPVLPQGVYAYDYLNSDIGNTFNSFYSVRFETFENGSYKETKIEDGVVIVTENKIEAILKMADGKVHRVVYEGSLELGYIEVPEPDYYSTLTEDLIFNHTEGTIRLNYFGDYYGLGASNWTVSMVLPGTNINGDYFIIDIVTDSVEFNASNIVGTYTCVEEANVAKNTFIAGYYEGGFGSSWYFVAVDNYYGTDDVAPIVDGTITIREEGIKYVVEFDCMDDNGHKIAGTFACSGLEMYDNSK
jgi:hypothetical protein